MAELPGTIRIELTPEMKQYVSGFSFTSAFSSRSFNTKESKYRPILEAIKKIPGVKDVWFTDDKKTDLLVEIVVNSLKQGNQIESEIRNIAYVKTTELHMPSVEIQQ
jgi:hypothetical protein